MNFLEAYKSGKRFRRHGDWDWCDTRLVAGALDIPVKDVLAEDWEIEEETVTITRSQLMQAIGWTNYSKGYIGNKGFTELLAEHLGFKP